MKLLYSGILALAGGALLSASPITSFYTPGAGLFGVPVGSVTPEPSTVAMLAVGSLLLGVSRFRRRKS